MINAEIGELLEYSEGREINVIAEGKGYLNTVESGISAFEESLIRKPDYKIGNGEADGMTAGMMDKMSESALLLIKKVAFSSPIIIRFHNDADGTGGALSIYKSLKDVCSRLGCKGNVVWMMQKGVSYSTSDAATDILISNNYSCIEKPLLINLDFGTSMDSNLGISDIKERFDIIWFDHHPVTEAFEGLALRHYINPWNFGGDSSYTAGLLASAFCKTFSDSNTREFERASLIGDHSSYADSTWNTDMATMLDFITSDPEAVYGSDKSNVTPQEIESVINDGKRFMELLHYANMRMDEALNSGMKSLRLYQSDVCGIYVLDFENVKSEDSRYPLPGRFSSRLLDRILSTSGGEAMLIVHAGQYISIRLSEVASEKIDLLGIINSIKGSYTQLIESGGGHLSAAGIKVTDKSEKKRIINAIINKVKEHG